MSKKVYCNSKVSQSGVWGADPPVAGGHGGLGAKPPADGRVFIIFWKESYFNTMGSHFASVQSHLKGLDF